MASVKVAIRQSPGVSETSDQVPQLRHSIIRPRLEPIENSLLFSIKMDLLGQTSR